MRRSIFFTATFILYVLGCGTNDAIPVKPDPVGVGGASATNGSSSSGSSGGGGGYGGGEASGTGGATSSTPDGQIGFVSGSRLRARYLEGPDGSRQYIGFYDTVMQANCEYLWTKSGVRRCLPSAKSDNVFDLGNYFHSNSSCTSKAILPYPNADFAASTQYASVLADQKGSSDKPVWQDNYVWTVVSVSQVPNIYLKQGTQCILYSGIPGFAVNGVANEDDWVQATAGTE